MPNRVHVWVELLLAIIVVSLVAWYVSDTSPATQPAATVASVTPAPIPTAQPPLPAIPTSTPAATTSSTSAPPKTAVAHATNATVAPTAQKKTPDTPTDPNQVHRLEDPYTFDPLPVGQLNTDVRAALVNILCTPRQGGAFSPISGSGVIIDPRGIILTNAHVAQYVMLSQSPRINIRCVIRTGAPAKTTYSAEMLYIPSIWIDQHVADFGNAHPQGTGEHDYAFLRIIGSQTSTPLPASFPFIAPDTREGVAFVDDQILAASYPAEFLGGTATEYSLFPASSVSTIADLVTFGVNSIDVLSLGGIIEAQSGSSGGAVANMWGRLVGLIVTTSEGDTTSQRDLHALTLSYVNRDLIAQTGANLDTLLSGDVAQKTASFSANSVPSLVQKYLDRLPH